MPTRHTRSRRFATVALLLALLPLAPLGCSTPNQDPATVPLVVPTDRLAHIDAILAAYRQGNHDRVNALLQAFPTDDPAAQPLARLTQTPVPTTQPNDELTTHRIAESGLAYTEWRHPNATPTGGARARVAESSMSLFADASPPPTPSPAMVSEPTGMPARPAGGGGGGDADWRGAVVRNDASTTFEGEVLTERRLGEVKPDAPADAEAPPATAGTLTAGSLDDLANPQPLLDFANTFPDGHPIADRFAGPNFALRVTDADGNPLPNAFVLIHDQHDHTFATLTTAPDGRAALAAGHDNLPDTGELFATVYYPGVAPFTTSVHPDTPETHTITLPDATPEAVGRLDLAFVVDCTGSMGDEIRYLQAELKDVVSTVAAKHPDTDIRLSLIVYRDTTDDYVVRVSDWTRDIDAFLALLDKQSAGGGGDYPEAVDQALHAAAGLDWSTQAAARVVFLVGDAPSHPDHMPSALDAVDELRDSGVRVYPVLGSQDGDEPQLLFRAAALLTGARHLFLTDDSGVGGSHVEPEQGASFDVEPLNALMARILDAELTGQPIEKGDAIIRRVDG
ncbi:MAG: VWA domain-containing protein [Planctomycetota bacterium]